MCSICQVIQNPSFRMSFCKSSCQQALVHHLLIVKFSSQWLTVDFDRYLTCRCSASFCHEPSSWNATVAPISMATCLPLTSAPPLHNQWESEWVLDTEILLCNSVADVMCVIFIVNLAKGSVKIFRLNRRVTTPHNEAPLLMSLVGCSPFTCYIYVSCEINLHRSCLLLTDACTLLMRVRVALRYDCLVKPLKTSWPCDLCLSDFKLGLTRLPSVVSWCADPIFWSIELISVLQNRLITPTRQTFVHITSSVRFTATLGYFHGFRFYQAHPQQHLSL